jgi:DNA-binding CsgD family transcriptional regulator
VLPGWPAAAEEPERRQLLEVDPTHVRFRHELARRAIASSLPVAARRRLHAEILDALLAADADPADIVHHAEAAGVEGVVADYALVAARRAAALDSNREAYAHYRRASELAGRLPVGEQAVLLEELANAAYLVGRLDDAFVAIERAAALYREAGDESGVGRCTRRVSRLHWFAGDGVTARAAAADAIAILEPLGESIELAGAYSGLSQLSMLAQDVEQGRLWGERALELATRLGDDQTRAHALVNLGTVRLLLDPNDTAALVEAHVFADGAGYPYDAARALVNLGGVLLYWIDPAAADGYARRALAYAREHEVHNLGSYAAATAAWIRLRAGAWEEAERVARAEIEKGVNVTQLLAKTLLADLAVRRGDPDATAQLADVTAQADRTGDPQQITPVLELAIERALTANAPAPRERIRQLVDECRSRSGFTGATGVRLAAWASVAGVEAGFDGPSPAPFAAMLERDWQAAADGFGDVGWSYDRGLMLSLLDGREPLAEAIEIARGLGAAPLQRRVAARMRELGLTVPPGPRKSTRANPAGLTARQLEVLSLLAAGLTNAEIAERLVVSQRTAEHHVAAVLAKLGVATRRQAAQRAAELELA